VLLRPARGEAPAELREHELLAVRRPPQREDLPGLLDAGVGEGRRVEREAGHARRERADLGDGRDARSAAPTLSASSTAAADACSKDPRGQFLRELGYQPSAKIDKLAGKGFGFEVAKERVDLLDVDRLFLLIDAPARKKRDGDDLFNRLTVAREHRVVDLPYATTTQLGAAVAFNSVLSIPYALDGIGKSLTER
jgi:hypothetical protein